MTSKDDRPRAAAEVRRRAEKMALERAAQSPEVFQPLSPEETRRTLHQLRVHQIELEMQNEELRRAQEELDAARARYFDLYDLAPVGYCTVSEPGLILEANLTAAGLLGVARGSLVQQPITRFILKQDQDIYYLHHKQLFETGAPQVCELRMLRAEAAPFWARLEAAAAGDSDGTSVCRFALSDVTDRKRTEEALRESEERRHRSILRTAMDGFWRVDGQGRLLEVNETYSRMSGYSEQQLLAMSIPDLEAVEGPAERATRMQRLIALGEHRFETRHRRKDGSTFPVEVSVQYKEGEGGHLIAFLRDITERKRAEEALRESEDRYRSLFEQSGDSILLLELADGPPLILDANQAALRAHGYSREEMVGQPISLIEPDITQEAVEERSRLAEGKPTYMRHRRRDGSVFEVESVARWIRIGARNVVLAVDRDITERKLAEEEHRQLQAQLAQAQKMESIGRLAGGVAHDFNNLLTVINGYSQLLFDGLNASDPLRTGLGEIHKAGERAAGLTRQLLAFSRRQVLAPCVLDLNRVVEEMRPMLERLMGEAVELRIELKAESATVHADPHQLGQVIMNLAVNARDAMPDGGRMLIETAGVEWDQSYALSHPEVRAGRYVVLAVSDSGTGMDEATRQRIFEPFFTTKGVGQGTGLGLSMIQGIVAQSGGYIEVCSEPGQGTSFKIYLPALAEAAADDGRPAAVPALRGEETVLVVEDQAEVRDYAVAVLKAYGYHVIKAGSAGEALLLSEREHGRIRLVLTDVVMPNVSGRELADRIDKLRPGINVLFMSGYTDEVIVHQGMLEEGAKFIQKPFSPEELARKVRAVLGPPALRILVADDEAGVRGFLRAVLEGGGYEVTEAADGKQALKEARAAHVDLVITDLVMPKQEGIQTIQALRKEMPGIKIIAITGKFEGPYLKMVEMLGANAVLTKPVGAELLLGKVAEVLKPRRP